MIVSSKFKNIPLQNYVRLKKNLICFYADVRPFLTGTVQKVCDKFLE